MSRLVIDPRSQAGFNPHLRMSNGAMASVKFKLDKEKAKYEKTIEIINLTEKMEMRIAQKQVEEVKKELTLMKAYQHVAKQMAFKNFDPVIRRRRERREKARREEEEAEAEARERQQEREKQQHLIDSGVVSDAENAGDDGDLLLAANRRMSTNGNVFVTLQDIIGNDDVLRRNSREINDMRRKSQASLELLDYGDDSFVSDRRRKSDASYKGKIRSPRRGSMASVEGSEKEETGLCNDEDVTDGGIGNGGHSKGNLLDVGRVASQRRRTSRAGSFVGLDSIEEHGLEAMKEKEKNNYEERGGSSKENKTSSLVVSGRKGFKTTGNLVKGFFITSSVDDSDEKTETEKKSKRGENCVLNDNREKPMSIYQISKFYEKQKSRHMEENKNAELNQQKRMERRKYESLRKRLQKEKFDKERRNSKKCSNTTKAVSAPDKKLDATSELAKNITQENTSSSQITQEDDTAKLRSNSVPLINEPQQEPETNTPKTELSESKSGVPLKGLARFKNAATTVSINLTIANPKKSKTNRLKNIAAAVMMKEHPTVGRVPKAFMYSDAFADRFGRERAKSKATALEGSHRKPEDCKIRPLAMPESVKAEYAVKWTALMGSINSAVHWKVKALREDTGTLNSRQIRRQAREEQPSVIDVSPRSPRNPPRSVFPGACKTTWAVKKFVSQEIDDVLKAWHPDNVRRKRNQRMKAKVSLPDFIDRVRTTNSILRSFRSYCKVKGDRKDDENEGDGVNSDNDCDDDVVLDDEDDDDDKVGDEIFV